MGEAGEVGGGLAPATRPTMYFVGVSTTRSSIMQVFPRWAETLGLGDCVLRGIDLPLHAPPDDYWRVVEFIKTDRLSLGALVTAHKLDLYAAARDLFDDFDDYAASLAEVSCLSKAGGRLIGHAKDPAASGLALRAMLPRRHWKHTRAACLALGAGGATLAISAYLAQREHGADRPSRLVITDRDAARLDAMAVTHRRLGLDLAIEYRDAGANDALLGQLPRGSLVINATGMGKDAPGSPLAGTSAFPLEGIAWELNYRGDLVFLSQARAQQTERRLSIHDGWVYFLHGWTRAIAEVFRIEIASDGPGVERLASQAEAVRT